MMTSCMNLDEAKRLIGSTIVSGVPQIPWHRIGLFGFVESSLPLPMTVVVCAVVGQREITLYESETSDRLLLSKDYCANLQPVGTSMYVTDKK